jgi:formamidopyrimidine-DNA glycosylase
MPELPEVETIARDLAVHLLHRRINAVEVLAPKIVSPSAAIFKTTLIGRKITKIDRRGKLLILTLSPLASAARSKKSPDWQYLLIHLKMTGQLIYLDQTQRVAGGHSLRGSAAIGRLPNQHTRVYLVLAGSGRLFFNDIRKFGYLKLATAEELAAAQK